MLAESGGFRLQGAGLTGAEPDPSLGPSAGPGLIALALIVLCGSQAAAAETSTTLRESPPPAAANPPSLPAQDQAAKSYAKIQAQNDKILDMEGETADALDRTANLLGIAICIGLGLALLFAGLVLAARRTAKASVAAARALPILERAYVFLGKQIALTSPECVGPSAAVNLVFHASFTNHGRTPAVVRWINLDHHYLTELPSGAYEDHERHGAGMVIGAGETHVLADRPLTIPRSEWDRAKAGDGALYLDGRIVYRDIFAVQHETYFCWRYDIPGRAFAVVESEALNRYD